MAMNRLPCGLILALCVPFLPPYPAATAATFPFCGEFISLAAGSFPAGIVAADVDEDGLTDLVVANQADYSISIFSSNGDATFRRRDIPIGTGPVGIAARDLDGDGTVDLIAADPGGFLTVGRGEGAGGFLAASHYPP